MSDELSQVEMKDSGIEWIGEIPSHWELNHLRTTIENYVSGTWGNEADGVSDVICIRVADFDFEKLQIKKGPYTLRSISLREKGNLVLKRGDLLLEKSGGGEQQPVGRVVIFTENFSAVTSNFITRLRSTLNINCRYILYVHAALYFAGINRRSIKQTTGIQNLDQKSYLGEIVPVPPLPAQQAIANYLDSETARIDALVEKKNRLIDLLKEKRQALITHTVTKGLDPSVEMKDSGIEWIGEIPKGWEVKRLKSFVDLTPGQSPPSDSVFPTFEEEGLPFLQGNAEFGHLHPEPTNRCDTASRICKVNDFLLSIRAPVGAINIADRRYGIGRGLCAISPLYIEQKFLWYSIVNSKSQLLSLAVGSTYDAVTGEDIGSLYFVLPTLEEQQAIANYLDNETARIDSIVEKLQTQIILIKEHRQALITATLTGKLNITTEVA